MVKLREAFSQKIHLHIKQDMLQELWDKYVPVESSEYENIQLIYLDGGAGQTSGQPGQIQLLISFVLKNRIMRMGLEGYPVKTALLREQMGNSLQRMEKYYLMQLKCCDFAMFRKVSRYVELLTQAEADVRRYRNWQKDHQVIEKQRDRYRLFSLFSSEIKEFLTEHSVQAMRSLEREILYALSEKEYRHLAESVVWQEKERFLSFLENCNEVQCRKITKRLEETGIRINIKQLKGRPDGKAFAEAADQLGQKEFYLFYRQAVRIEGADGQFVLWKGKKEKMLSYIEKQESETVRQLWTQMENSSVFSEKLVQLGEQYFREVIKEFRERVTSMVSTEKFKEIADMADFLWEELEREPVSGSRIASETEIRQMTERIESELKLHREQIERREAQSYLKYRKEYREILGEDGFEIPARTDFQNIYEWGRTVIENFSETESPKIQKMLSYIHELKEEKREEFIENLADMIHVWQKVNSSAQSPLQAAVTEEDGIDLPARTDLLRHTEEIFRSQHEEKLTEEELQNIYEWGRTVIENFSETESTKIQKLLSHIRELKEEKQEEFIENLADMIHVWQKVNSSAQSPLQAAVTEEDGIDLPARTDLLRHTEEIFRSQHEEKLTEEELHSICEWGRTVIEDFSETESPKIQNLLSYIQELNEETAEIPYHELWEWGKALLFYTEHEQERTDADLLPGYQENLQEDLSSDIIHRQIEAAKDRNSLQRLVTQINHRVDSMQEPLEQKFRLEYADRQLNMPQVQSLLRYVRKLDEKQYGILIKELSQVTKIQWMQHIGQEIRKADVIDIKRTQDERIAMERTQDERIAMERTQDERIDIEQRWDSRQLAAAYPKLVTHIREFEEQRHKRIREEITTLENNVLLQDQMIYLEEGVSYDIRKTGGLQPPAYRESTENGIGLESIWENSIDLENVWENRIDLENVWENRNREWKLQYSAQNAQMSGEEQQRDKMRMQEETNQLRSAQEQIDKKLQEVEVQLKKLETTAKAKEDVRDLADKVKRQLYEELHIEKLRRGLV